MNSPVVTRFLTAIVCSLLLISCSKSIPGGDTSEPADAHAHHRSLPAGDALTGESLYLLPSAWTNQLGVDRRWRDFSGRVVVLAMVYSHCDNACPRIIADMRRIRHGLGDQADVPVFVLASIDSDRDTVEHLHKFGQETGLNELGWELLRAPEGTVRELAAVLGVQYRRVSETDFTHSNIITVLGTNGEIAHRQQGLGVEPDATIAAIETLLQAPGTTSRHEHK